MQELSSLQYDTARCEIFADIITLINKLDFKVYFDIDWAGSTKRVFAVTGATIHDNIYQLRDRFQSAQYDTIGINTRLYDGFYLEARSGIIGLFLAPVASNISSDQTVLNTDRGSDSLDELKAFGGTNNIISLRSLDYPSYFALSTLLDFASAQALGTTYTKFKNLLYHNTHKEYLRNYHAFKNTSAPSNIAEYSHIRMFSKIYYLEIKLISELTAHTDVSIHDAGTNTAHFPLLLSGLSKSDAFDTVFSRILASDFELTSVKNAIDIADPNPAYERIDFMKIDLTGDISDIPATDIVILNDVLEHLPDDEHSLSALKKLWEKTNMILIAHVPFEPEPNASWDHHITFNEQKLRDWAAELPGSAFISENYTDGDKSLISLGFLIVKRNDRAGILR